MTVVVQYTAGYTCGFVADTILNNFVPCLEIEKEEEKMITISISLYVLNLNRACHYEAYDGHG